MMHGLTNLKIYKVLFKTIWWFKNWIFFESIFNTICICQGHQYHGCSQF